MEPRVGGGSDEVALEYANEWPVPANGAGLPNGGQGRNQLGDNLGFFIVHFNGLKEFYPKRYAARLGSTFLNMGGCAP